MAIDYNDYPVNWKTEIRPRILERAHNKCEWCRVENYAVGARDIDGEWWNEDDIDGLQSDQGYYLFGEYPKIVKIVLTIAHLHEPDPMNCADDNLAALCQRCHLNHDRPHHLAKQRFNRLERKDQARQERGERKLL